MIKFYKGNPIIIKKSINGRGSYTTEFIIVYRYAFCKFKRYKKKVTLSDKLTIGDAYEAVKILIDDLDNITKLN